MNVPPERGITRRDLEAVIRRAVELSAADSDLDERISEDELLRIASELGIEPRHIRQAMVEAPNAEAPAATALARIVERKFGPARLRTSRAVPNACEVTLSVLEEYLTAREFLRLRRRHQGVSWFEPADDTLSSVTRAFSSLGRKHHLVEARRTMVGVQALDRNTSHVTMELDFEHRRKSAVQGGLTVGGLFGALAGVGIGGGVILGVGGEAGIIAGIAAGLGTFATGLSTGLSVAGAGFRRKVAEIRVEVEAILDRLEQGDRLEPPPSPWKRRLFGPPKPRGRP